MTTTDGCAPGARAPRRAGPTALACAILGATLASAQLAAAADRAPNSEETAYSALAGGALEGFPRLEAELTLELENDATYRAQDDEEELNSLFARAELELELALSPSFGLEAELALQPIEDADDGRLEEQLRARDESPKNREFDSHALFLEQFFLTWEREDLELRAGKFNPRFGRAYEFSVGPFGDEDDFAEDYAIEERLGLGATLELGGPRFGSHELSIDAFTLDTTKLSRSLLFSRGGLKRSDGGPSNTGSPNSFGVALEGEDIPGVPGLSYNLGFVYQKGGRRGPFPRGRVPGEDEDEDDDDERGSDDEDDDDDVLQRDRGSLERNYVAGLGYSTGVLDSGLGIDLLTEYVYIDNANGQSGRLLRFLTASGRASWRQLQLGVSYTLRSEALPRASDARDFILLTSVGYFQPLGDESQLGFETGFRVKNDGNDRSNTLALRLSYRLEF